MKTEDFLKNQGQTNPYPLLLEIDKAKGSYIYDKKGKAYLDMIAGVAVNNIGHGHPTVVEAIKKQVDRHLHVMVYGEFVQEAPLELAKQLSAILPNELSAVYPVNSGAEANEAAMKLVKRITSRSEIIAFSGAYHGSTQGALSLSSNSVKKSAFAPLLPGIKHIQLNHPDDLRKITTQTAAVFLETIQGDAGVRIPNKNYLNSLRKRCSETGTLLVFDEIQCGMGRSGKMFAFEHFDVVPDIITLGKALGGGMSIGALISSQENLNYFSDNPTLGHITTFGGHPVNCAAAVACLKVFKEEISFEEVEKNAKYLETELAKISLIKTIRRIGMMYACDMESAEIVNKVVLECMNRGLLTFWFLSHPYSFRLSPPLNISKEEIDQAIVIIREVCDSVALRK